MEIEFRKFSDFERGTFFELLVDAYSFDERIVARCAETWRKGWIFIMFCRYIRRRGRSRAGVSNARNLSWEKCKFN